MSQTEARFLLDAILAPADYPNVTAVWLDTGEGKLTIRQGSLMLDRDKGHVSFEWRRMKDVGWERLTRPITSVLGAELIEAKNIQGGNHGTEHVDPSRN